MVGYLFGYPGVLRIRGTPFFTVFAGFDKSSSNLVTPMKYLQGFRKNEISYFFILMVGIPYHIMVGANN